MAIVIVKSNLTYIEAKKLCGFLQNEYHFSKKYLKGVRNEQSDTL